MSNQDKEARKFGLFTFALKNQGKAFRVSQVAPNNPSLLIEDIKYYIDLTQGSKHAPQMEFNNTYTKFRIYAKFDTEQKNRS